MAALFLVVVACMPAAFAERGPSRHVDPFIGTGGHGHTYPGATLPFGMVQLSPDTRLTGWDGCSGYHHSDHVVYGFSHTHLSGTGVLDYGDVLLMPVTGEIRLRNGHGEDPGAGYASRFDKASERAEAGWYAVELADHDVSVELTATERSGWHRYRFPRGKPGHVVVDLAHRDEVLDASLRIVSDREIEGHRRSTGWARDQVVHFVARFSRPFTRSVLARGDSPVPGARHLAGKDLKAGLSFGDRGGELLVKVGISAVDVDGARRNLDVESPGWRFDEVRRAARRAWNRALGRVEVRGGTADERVMFYTALYHAMVAPNVFSDVDGRYRGMDRKVHRATGRRHYTVFSLWDTFRAAHPLYVILEPERTREFVATFLAQYEQGGRLPVWELAGNETDTMIGYHAVSVIADAWVKGIRGFDGERALEAMVHSATRDHFGLESYRRQGYIGALDEPESVSKTLEYAYDDACIARMAQELRREDVARQFRRRSQSWRHLLDPETGFMRPKVNQAWLDPFDPRRVDLNYTEANSWQYSFFVPHDVEGLIEALGGPRRFASRLDALFEADPRTTGRDQADITGLIGQYAHGNEPSHHMAWLYHYTGRPAESMRRVRQILDTLYTPRPDGLSGNEDCGQMSSWYVFGALGLYPVNPGSDEYVIGAPIFDRVTLQLDPGTGGETDMTTGANDSGTRFEIRRSPASSGDRFVISARLNGEPLERSYLRHREIVAGGVLELTLGDTPDPRWGVASELRPRSRVAGPRVLPAPFVRSPGYRFQESIAVELDCPEAGATILYRPVGPGSGDAWTTYREPLLFEDSTRIRFVAELDGLRSPEVEATFHRIPNDWRVELATAPNPQYTAGGPGALIDGLRGGRDWRIGGWHGYQAVDFHATVDLRRAQTIRHVGASFLQDVRSWIWMPTEVVFSVSTDGRRFHEVARVTNEVRDDEYGIILRDLGVAIDATDARFVRVRARSYGAIPDWHPGRGEAAFIFVDEILIE